MKFLNMTIPQLLCALPKRMGGGHPRGKRDTSVIVEQGEQGFRCPRCSATWARKAKPVKLRAVA